MRYRGEKAQLPCAHPLKMTSVIFSECAHGNCAFDGDCIKAVPAIKANLLTLTLIACSFGDPIVFLAMLVQYRLVTNEKADRQTERQTQGHNIYRASIASLGKNIQH